MKMRLVCFAATAALLFAVAPLQAQPDMVTVSGTIADLTCAAKGKVMMGSYHNAENDEHKTPEGPKPGCATMCLKNGQPAALYDGEKITAVLACNAKWTLAEFAAEEVEVEGFWAGSPEDDARSFVPVKIRSADGGEWQDVDCATMHG